MSKQLFEFVKVAAGEPVDVGSLVCYMQPDVRAMVRELSFGPGGKAPHDFWFLRPAESPDAGREGFIEKVRNFVDNNWNPAAVADFMRSHWPTPADPGSQVEAVIDSGAIWAAVMDGWKWDKDEGLWLKSNPDYPGWDRKSHSDIVTLYKQSLNENK